jgi:hypothetical protein
MRKFVVKNRRKRKYVRKSQKNSEFAFSKTLFGMLPVLIMGIAFMATVVISAPFRNSLSHVRFTFQLPQISYTNPTLFFQTLFSDVAQIGLFATAFVQALWISIHNSFTTIGYAVDQSIYNLNPLPIFVLLGNWYQTFMNTLANSIGAVTQIISNALGVGAQTASSASVSASTGISTFALSFISSLAMAGQIVIGFGTIFLQTIIKSVIFSTQITLWICSFVFYAFLNIVTVMIQVLIFVANIAWTWISFALTIVWNFISFVLYKILTAIEIPFKVMGAFGLAMKPYTDILWRHIQMTGQDLMNGFKDLGEVTTSLSPSK